MELSEVMGELEKLGTAQNRKIYKRHGAGGNFFGVSFADLHKLKKRIKTDQKLAEELWSTGNVDARTLATMIADPKSTSEELLDDWLSDISYYVLADYFVRNLVSKSACAYKKMEQWTESDDEWIGHTGWTLLALLALEESDLSDAYFDPYIKKIEKNIHKGKNRMKQGMNNALIGIGTRNKKLKKKALEAAGRIGKVEIDHGETYCKTPDATSYINKTWKRKRK
jgi:3-methyladenine DNA glycosylase AlkD